MASALQQPYLVEKYLHEELQASQVVQIYPSDDIEWLGIMEGENSYLDLGTNMARRDGAGPLRQHGRGEHDQSWNIQ